MTTAPRLLRSAALAAWRASPPALRRGLAHAAISVLAPRPSVIPTAAAGLDGPLPWIVAGFLSSPSGLGQSARLAVKALSATSHAVAGIDLAPYFYEASGEIENTLPDGRALTGPGNILLVVNAPYVPYAMWLVGNRCVQGKRIIGYWAWEQPAVPASWRRGLPYVHAIAVPSRFTAQAVAALTPLHPVGVAPHPVALDPIDAPGLPPEANGAHPFTVLSVLNVASGFERKNPLALIAAYRRAFGDRPDCRLRLLVTNAEHFGPARPAIEAAVADAANIEICWHGMTRPEFVRWWGTPDVVASLHRSEGFGLTLAEAMLAGCPVVATGWSGNADFMDEETAFPIRYRLVDINDPQGKYAVSEGQWAEPDIEHAAETLRKLEQDPGLRREVGRRARAAMLQHLSAEAFVASLDALAGAG